MLLTYIKLCAFIHIVVYAYIVNTKITKVPSWSWSYGSYIYNYLCNHWSCEFEARSGEVYSIQHYVTKLVNYLRPVSGFLRALRFPPPIKLTAMI